MDLVSNMKRRNQKGFTLIEIVLTITLLTFGTIPIISCISRGITMDQSVEGQSIALKLAQQQLETIENEPNFADVASAGITNTPGSCPSPYNTAQSNYTCEVLISYPNSPNDNIIQVVSNVYYGKSQASSVSLASYISNVAAGYPGT